MSRIESDDALRQLLAGARVIAVVGHSNRPSTASYQIARFLRQAGYSVYPVNPTISEIDGQPCYGSLAEVPERIDIVNVFRRPEHLPGVVDEAVAAGAGAVWAQSGISSAEAEARAQAAGMPLVMDRCIKVAYNQLIT